MKSALTLILAFLIWHSNPTLAGSAVIDQTSHATAAPPQPAPAESKAIPEPKGIVIMAFAGLVIMVRHRLRS